MRRRLEVDEATGEYRLVITDLYNGQHERDEFRVLAGAGEVLRSRGEDDPVAWVLGRPVHEDRGSAWPYHVTSDGPWGRKSMFRVEDQAVGPTVRTPCRRLASPSGRAKCALCAEEATAS